MKRVLHIIRTMNMGGAQVIIMNLYRNINRQNIQFDFLLNEKGIFDDEIRKLGGTIFYMPYLTQIGPNKYKKELENFFAQHLEYKIIHSHMNQVSGLILEAAKRAEVPYRIAHAHSTNNKNHIVGKIYKKYLQHKINNNANYRFACSEDAGKWLYSGEKFTIIKNGIDFSKFAFDSQKREQMRKQLGINSGCIVIGNVGRFSKVKNHTFLINLFKKFQEKQEAKLLLIGEGKLKQNMIQKVQEEKLEDKVIFQVEKEHIEDYYQCIDLYICPSLYEGIPLTLIEAQCNGIPILASNTIDKNVKIMENVQFENLSSTLDIWLKDIEELLKEGRTQQIEKIEKAGYNIKQQARKLEKIYMQMNEKR